MTTWHLSTIRQKFKVDKNTQSCIHAMVVLFFYVLSYTLTTVLENQFYIDKTCMANFRHNISVCGSLITGNNTDEEVEIQKYVATFRIYNNLVRQVLPMVPGFLMAAWSDAHGARAPIHIGMAGKTFYFLGYALSAHFFVQWPVEYVLLSAALPRALAGYDIGIFMAVRAHLAEATPPEHLTQRLATMEMINRISVPVGLTIGSVAFTASQRDYVVSFLISTTVSTLGLFYGAVFVRNFKRERSKKMINCEDFHLVDNIKSICSKSTVQRYKSLYILIIIMFLHSMMYDSPLLFLFTQFKFRWDTETFTKFQITESSFSVIISGLVAPLLRRTAISDLFILGSGVCMVIISRLCYAITNVQWVLYIGAFTSSFQALINISVYSMVSKITDVENRGKFIAVFTTIESVTSIISSPLYSSVYSATILTAPSAIFYISVTLQCLILGLVLLLKYMGRKN